MAIILNDNIKINAGKPSEAKYLTTGNTVYISKIEAATGIPIAERHVGLTVNINHIEYWFKDGVAYSDLVEKKYDSEIPSGDFVTGATNIGFFSGFTGIQMLPINHSSDPDYDGDYYSLYNYYYRDVYGYIRFGTPQDGIPRRGYVMSGTSDKSWIWNDSSFGGSLIGWILINDNIENFVGIYQNGVTYYNGTTTFPHTETGYTNGVYYPSISDVTINTVEGSLTTGNTLTIGGPVYSHREDNNLQLRTIKSATPEILDITYDESFVYISGSSESLGGQNIGTGSQVFSGKTGNTFIYRTIKGSGDTIVSQTDDEIIIYSSGGTGGYNLFTEDIVVSIDAGKTFGKYLNGDTIPASGKTANEVIILACFEAKNPTVNLSSSSNNVVFGESGKTVNLNFSYTINTLGASVLSVLLETRRGNTGAWNTLTTDTGSTSYNHNIDDSSNRFNTSILNYRYIVVDTEGMTGQTIHNVTPQSYAAPSMSLSLNGSVSSPETQTSREKGNVDSSPSGSIVSNRSLINITGYTVDRQVNGGGYVSITSVTGINLTNVTIPQISDIGVISSAANSINYRISYFDEYSNGNGGIRTIGFNYFSFYGYNTKTILNSSDIIALGNGVFLSSRVRTMILTAGSLDYTYISYPASFGALTSAIQNGSAEVIGAFTELTQVSVTNSYGESNNYRVYKSNAPGAFNNDTVAFS